jgi:FAS-associated factor 2
MASTKSPEEIELERLNQSGSRIGIFLPFYLLTLDTARPPPQKLTFWSLLRSPFTTIHRILAFITAFFPFISRFALPTTPSRRQLSPRDTASRFLREFEERYGREHIPFDDRGYAEVTQQVKTSLQFLMVILVSEEHDDTAAFCKDVLCDVELLTWVRANECVVWAGNVADSEAHTGIYPLHSYIL